MHFGNVGDECGDIFSGGLDLGTEFRAKKEGKDGEGQSGQEACAEGGVCGEAEIFVGGEGCFDAVVFLAVPGDVLSGGGTLDEDGVREIGREGVEIGAVAFGEDMGACIPQRWEEEVVQAKYVGEALNETFGSAGGGVSVPAIRQGILGEVLVGLS